MNKYHYRESGMDNVWLLNGFTIKETPYGEGVAISDLDGLHKCIAQMLVEKPEPLTGREFRFLRIELDLSQNALGEIIGLGDRQIRNWETGKGAVPQLAELVIRLMYQEISIPETTFSGLWKDLKSRDKPDDRRLNLKDTKHGWLKAA